MHRIERAQNDRISNMRYENGGAVFGTIKNNFVSDIGCIVSHSTLSCRNEIEEC